ncbi:hypothetical protein ONS95_002151 [Cadophora gregata]|uniref:uncharacterized protein n=1 Tax=Cadophora gregata TaxID=51156 RepID=UPI0026DABC0D|nr:uncharacterized protein ONS95_002151 [Cadophora gregata]KAK0109458.1 hypothetical protein ONS95_002151 [Cadophora gregata]KAK0110913.1 hypothetical protein ONS96_002499 [Cadophora gregata f. sp. sojae]
MSYRKPKSISETANRSINPAGIALYRGMYKAKELSPINPSHTCIESKVPAPADSFIGSGLIRPPLTPWRPTPLLDTLPSAETWCDLESPSCPPSHKARLIRRRTARAMSGRPSTIFKTTVPAKKISACAEVSKALESYTELMKRHSALAVPSSAQDTRSSPPDLPPSSHNSGIPTPPMPINEATPSLSPVKLSFTERVSIANEIWICVATDILKSYNTCEGRSDQHD